MQEHDAAVGRVGPEKRGANRLGQAEPDRAADQRAEEIGDLGLAEARLHDHHQHAERGTDEQVDGQSRTERLRQDRGVRHRDHEERTDDEVPGHDGGSDMNTDL